MISICVSVFSFPTDSSILCIQSSEPYHFPLNYILEIYPSQYMTTQSVQIDYLNLPWKGI